MKIILLVLLSSTILVFANTQDVSSEIYDKIAREELSANIMDKLIQTEKPKDLFKIWHFVFKPSYSLNSQEGVERYKKFLDNLEKVKDHNSKNLSYTLGLNQFSDLTSNEFGAKYLTRKPTKESMNERIQFLGNYFDEAVGDDEDDGSNLGHKRELQAFPKIDHNSFFRPIKDQGFCGSCWAFSAIHCVEAVWNKKNPTAKLNAYLSTQELIDCDNENNGCDGGLGFPAMTYLINSGIQYESSYLYKAVRSTCKKNSAVNSPVKIKSYNHCSGYNKSKACTDIIFQNLLALGPLIVGIDGYAIQSYRSGIFDPSTCKEDNHAVVLSAYVPAVGTTPAYYVIRNSYSSRWGEKGLIRVRKVTRSASTKITTSNSSCFVDHEAILPVA